MGVMSAYLATIGLEIHAELKTRTKMFCASKNDPNEEEPNVNVCPICLAHPGTLPTINKEAVKHVLRVGTALGGTIADYTEFDRKSYFYPDIPKGYQISQYEHPLVSGGALQGVAITRVHLEEDTARSMHAEGESLVDFNRAGIPLMELVTEPVIHDATTAARFARELQLLLRTLGASDANLEKGEMRIEANISVSNTDLFGTKVEVKNLNSFKSVERAIAYEIERQTAVLEKGEKLVQETRGWNETTEETFHQRFKEGSADYRYFPEPDLPKMILSELPEFSLAALKESLPEELPWQMRERFLKKASPEAAEILTTDSKYRNVYSSQDSKKMSDEKVNSAVINMLTTEVRGKNPTEAQLEYLKANSALAGTMAIFVSGGISSTSAKVVINEILEKGGDPETIIREKDLMQANDKGPLEVIARAVIEENPKVVSEYRAGKENALQYLVGQAMKASKGSGNPKLFAEIFKELLR